MSKICFQSIIITRIQNTAPHLKFVARYGASEDSVKACMQGYENRTFVYVLTSYFGSSEFSIYVGKTKSQYARFLTHIKKYEFDHIYLFECNPDELNTSESSIIKELKPLYDYNYVSRYFHSAFNMSFTNFLNIYRLETAIRLLEETDKKITDIALESGFQSVRSFNNSFNLKFGISPREYKRNNFTNN